MSDYSLKLTALALASAGLALASVPALGTLLALVSEPESGRGRASVPGLGLPWESESEGPESG